MNAQPCMMQNRESGTPDDGLHVFAEIIVLNQIDILRETCHPNSKRKTSAACGISVFFRQGAPSYSSTP
jgi:hypothetical protein